MVREGSKDRGPKIVAFLCNWCSYEAADNAGTKRLAYPPDIIPIRVMCTGMIDPQFILYAFKNGADGVFIGGCHFGDCHYLSGNYKAQRRVALLKGLLGQLGIKPDRLRFEKISAAEADKFANSVTKFISDIRAIEKGGGGDV